MTFSDNTATSGGDAAYLADAAAADSLPLADGQAHHSTAAPKASPRDRLRCTRLNLNKTGSMLRVAGPPCALVLWSPAAGTLLPYVNNGSGLPVINATVVDCWCSTVQQIPGEYAAVA